MRVFKETWPPFVSGVLILSIATWSVQAAGPTDQNPELLLSPWTDESVDQVPVDYYSTAATMYAGVLEELEGYEQKAKAGKVKSLNLAKVGMTKAVAIDLEQYAMRLQDWGEPAGRDLALRTADLNARLDRLRSEMVTPFADTIAKHLRVLQQRCAQQQKMIKEVKKLIDEKKLTEAEKRFQGEYRKLSAMAYWYEAQQRQAPMSSYDSLYSSLNNSIRVANQSYAREVISKLCEKTRPDLKSLSSSVAKTGSDLSKASEVEFDGSTATGPKAFVRAAVKWYGMHRATLRTIGAHWAVATRDSGISAVDQVVSTYPDFQKEMLAGLAAIIEADAARANEAEAAPLYLAYVKGIADITSVSRDEEFINAFDTALDKLAAKSPTLLADVTAYRGATQDWLRWRARATERAAKGKTTAGGIKLPIAEADLPILDLPAPELIAKIAKETVGKETVLAATFISASKSGKPTSGYLNWMFCHALTAEAITDPTLESDLLVSDSTPALTLVAARALATQKRGALVEVGGKISGVELTGMIPFYAIDSDDRKAVVTMGALPKIATEGFEFPFKHLHIIANIEPSWVRGEYFFAEIK